MPRPCPPRRRARVGRRPARPRQRRCHRGRRRGLRQRGDERRDSGTGCASEQSRCLRPRQRRGPLVTRPSPPAALRWCGQDREGVAGSPHLLAARVGRERERPVRRRSRWGASSRQHVTRPSQPLQPRPPTTRTTMRTTTRTQGGWFPSVREPGCAQASGRRRGRRESPPPRPAGSIPPRSARRALRATEAFLDARGPLAALGLPDQQPFQKQRLHQPRFRQLRPRQ